MINHRFSIKQKLGEGRSEVFLCRDLFFPGIEFAIKILPSNVPEIEEEKFRQEFFTLQKLDHPNIINSFDYGTIVNIEDEDKKFGLEYGSKFFTTEFFGGRLLSEYKNKLDPAKLSHLLEEIIATLYYLHQSNYIYNDLKPENILVEEEDGMFSVKFIDFGLIIDRNSELNPLISGTMEYIAPERLQKKAFDHRIDFYSLGIIIYLMIYGEYPFRAKDDLEIFRAHVNEEFIFPEAEGFEMFIDLVKILLKKDPRNRMFSSLEIFRALRIDITLKRKKEWKPGNRFVNRGEISDYLPGYFSTESGKAIIINGDDGSGKTALLTEVFQKRKNSIFISRSMFRSGLEFWRYFIHKIIYLNDVYTKIDEALIQYLKNNQNESISIDSAKAIVSKISRKVEFTLLLDDFNFYDNLAHEFLNQLIPILQVNKIKILITENKSKPKSTDSIFNKMEFELRPFSESETGKLIKQNFADFFPRAEIKKLILKYSDHLPGNIYNFYDYLVQLEAINFENSVPKVNSDSNLPRLLSKSQNDIYDFRLSKLSDSEMRAAQILSTIVPEVDKNFLSLIGSEETRTHLNSIQSLKTANVVNETEGVIKFTSLGLKNYVYENIDEKKALHKKIAQFLENKTEIEDNKEIARHYKEAGDFANSYRLLKKEIELAEKVSLLPYKKILLEEVKDYPLKSEDKEIILYKYADVLYELGEYQECLKYIENDFHEVGDKQIEYLLLKLKGNCWIYLGEIEKGKIMLESIIDSTSNSEEKYDLYLDIANAEFDLNNYDKVEAIISKLNLGKGPISPSSCGRILNLKGLLKIHKENNPIEAIDRFREAQKILNENEEIGKNINIGINLGNLYAMDDDIENAINVWNATLINNEMIGSLENEGMILINKGVLNYFFENYEKSAKDYERANDIFNTLGNYNRVSLISSNLADIKLEICEYDKAAQNIELAELYLKKTNNFSELAEVLFQKSKLSLYIGDNKSIKKVKDELEMLIEERKVSSAAENIFNFVLAVESIVNDKIQPAKKYLKIYLDYFDDLSVQEDQIRYSKASFIIANLFLKENKFLEAKEILNDDKLKELLKQKSLLTAERLYLLSLIAAAKPELTEKPQFELLSESLKLIEDKSITELHYKVFFELAKYYEARGNINKRDYNLFYAKSLINFISESIDNPELKKLYLSEMLRKQILEEE